MTSTFKRSIPAAATMALALMFGAQAQAQTPLPPTSPAVVKGDQLATPAPAGTSTEPAMAPAARMPQRNSVSNTATPPTTKAKRMTMEERNESRMNREMAATNGGTTSPAANNVNNGAMPADPQAMGKTMSGKTRAERKAERDAKRMEKSSMTKPDMASPGMNSPMMTGPATTKP